MKKIPRYFNIDWQDAIRCALKGEKVEVLLDRTPPEAWVSFEIKPQQQIHAWMLAATYRVMGHETRQKL